MATAPPLLLTDNSVTIILNGNHHDIADTHPHWTLIREAIAEQRWEDLPNLVDIPKAVSAYTQGRYKVVDDELYFDDEVLHGILANRVLKMMSEGIKFDHMLKFHERLQVNPSHRAVEELYDFLEHENIPIGPEGCFYAYKAVDNNWRDKYSGNFDNSIGKTLSMPRNQVDDDRNRGCSKGFHVGALDYVMSYGRQAYGDRFLIVKVDPADVVSIPTDSAYQKVRVCKYTVVGEYSRPLPDSYYKDDFVPELDLADNDEEDYEYLDGPYVEPF